MSPEKAAKEKEKALRESQLDLYHRLQETLDEVSKEMLGNAKWETEKVDRSMEGLMDDLVEHFGIEEED